MPAKRSILLVDDENSILETLRMVFEYEGYEVATAKNSTEAVGLIKKNGQFDAVITDLNMEEEDIGLEVARAAMKAEPRPAVVICTGFASMANSRAALAMGVDYMAHKPVELRELISALNRLISRYRELRGRNGR
ncbi:MAG TPA: response regulator [Terriglobales bacterium]|nr:response regulator [Terriglobales bacterium]